MAESDIVKQASDANGGASQFSFEIASEFARENLPAEKRNELALVVENRRIDLAHDVAQRTIRLKTSSADMDQTLRKAGELSKVLGDFTIRSSHDTASGRTEIVVHRDAQFLFFITVVAALIVLLCIL